MAGQYFHEDVFEMAAAYLFHLVKNHPFVDGNKRVGLVAAIVFLDLNGVVFDPNDEECYDMIIDVIKGTLDKGEGARFIRNNSKSR